MIGTVENPGLAGKIIQGKWFDNEKLSETGMRIIKGARFTCRRCGFRSRPSKKIPHGYMVPIDVRHPGLAALEVEHGECVCPICASAMAINWSVVHQHQQHGEVTPAAGELIWLPEVDQRKISLTASFAITMLCQSDSTARLYGTAFDTDTAFRARKAHMAANLSLYKNDQDADFAKALSWLPREYYQHRESILEGVRFWPSASSWKSQTAYWYAGIYKPLMEG